MRQVKDSHDHGKAIGSKAAGYLWLLSFLFSVNGKMVSATNLALWMGQTAFGLP